MLKTIKKLLTIHSRPSTVSNLPGFLTLALGKKADTYTYALAPSDEGVAFTLTHSENPDRSYTCTIALSGSTCECKGFQFSRNHSCKHIDAMTALTSRDGLLEQSMAAGYVGEHDDNSAAECDWNAA